MTDLAPVVVIGDALLDVDLVGDADRLAPDAPVPVVRVAEERVRPGGAGLAALLARRQAGAGDGAREVVLVAPFAEDADGARLRVLLEAAGVRVVALPHSGRTVVKRRIRVDGQSLLRVDEGDAWEPRRLPPEATRALLDAGAVLVADYGQGATSSPGLRETLRGTSAPVVWDPHPRGARPVAGARLVTPSAAEAGLSPGARIGDVDERAADLVRDWRVHSVAITLGSRGALVSNGTEPPTMVPSPAVVGGGDVCGAGDCFSAAVTVALADGAVTSEAVQAGVVAAARFVGAGGAGAVAGAVAAVASAGDADAAGTRGAAGTGAAAGTGGTGAEVGDAGVVVRDEAEALGEARAVVDRVRAAGGTVVATGGCFDLLHAGHVATLRAARSLGDCLVVLLNSDDSIRRLKGPGRPIQRVEDRAKVLQALDAVDAVLVFDDDTPVETLRRLRPDVWTKGGDYSVEQLPEAAVVREWGGRTVVLPYLDGRSTTQLVADAVAGSAR